MEIIPIGIKTPIAAQSIKPCTLISYTSFGFSFSEIGEVSTGPLTSMAKLLVFSWEEHRGRRRKRRETKS
jgi:hypothetical protein